MRHILAMLTMTLALHGAPGPAAAQVPPAPAAEPDGGAPEMKRSPAAPRPFLRHPLVRREAASPSPNTPSDAPLATNGIATLGMMTGGLNSTYVQIGSDVSAVASTDSLRIVPLMGKGSLQNLADLLNLRGVDLALVSADAARSAEATRLYPDLRRQVQYIAKLYDQEIHILAAHDVFTVADLADKVVDVDVMGSGTAVTAPAVFESMHIPVKLAHEIPAVALEKLKRGEIAALAYVDGKPSRLFGSLPANSGLHLLQLPVSEDLLDTYVPATLTHADYPSLVPEGEDVETWAVPVLLTAYNWPAGTVRYNNLATFTDLLFSRLPDLQQPPYHEKWHDVNIRATVPGWTRAPYAQRWLERSKVETANASPAPVAGGFEKEAFSEWAARIGFTKMTAMQNAQLFSLWRLRRSQQ